MMSLSSLPFAELLAALVAGNGGTIAVSLPVKSDLAVAAPHAPYSLGSQDQGRYAVVPFPFQGPESREPPGRSAAIAAIG